MAEIDGGGAAVTFTGVVDGGDADPAVQPDVDLEAGSAQGVLSYPFRLTAQGTAATTGYGTDQEVDEAIAVLVLTTVGERPLAPEFGVPDPAFAGLHVGDIKTGLDTFGPAGIQVTDVILTPTTASVAEADILWTRDEE